MDKINTMPLENVAVFESQLTPLAKKAPHAHVSNKCVPLRDIFLLAPQNVAQGGVNQRRKTTRKPKECLTKEQAQA